MERLRIHITGASGSGTTTLGRALAGSLGLAHLDTDSFYWLPSDPPFELKRPLDERQELLMGRLLESDRWVLSGSLCSWGDHAIPLFDLVIFLQIPRQIRMRRLAERERERYGARILPGGDMERSNREFMAWAERYDSAGPEQRSRMMHEEWLATLPCPLLRIEGDISTDERISRVRNWLDLDE